MALFHLSIYPFICDTNNDWKPDLVRYVEMPQVTLGPLVWGDGEVSLELGSETVCRRVRFEGGLNRGLLGLFASLLSSFCRGEEITQLQGLHWPNDFWTLIPAAENKTSSIHNMATAIMIALLNTKLMAPKQYREEPNASDFRAAVSQPRHLVRTSSVNILNGKLAPTKNCVLDAYSLHTQNLTSSPGLIVSLTGIQ